MSKRFPGQKRLISAVLLIAFVFQASFAPLASADLFDVGNFDTGINKAVEKFETRYHINPNSLQDLGETMNVSSQKAQVPQMNIFFQPTDPKNGQQVTAQAFPMNFTSQKEDMYFTWYIKRAGCDIGSTKDECDLDNDGKSTVNDWKIQAMRYIANAGFITEGIDYGASGGDNDGYKAKIGGDKSVSNHCYVHDFDGGKDYELYDGNENSCKHLFPKSPGETVGDGSFGSNEEKFWRTDPKDPSTAQNGNKDEANVAGLGQDSLKWTYATGDQVGVVIEGASMLPTKYANASNKIMWAFTKNKCTPKNKGDILDGAGYNGSGGSDDGRADIPTVNMDLNDCLKDNLISPTDGDQAGKLELQLSSSPQNPVIDSYTDSEPDARGDTLTIQSTMVNSAMKTSNISYDWSVFANSKESATDDTAWEDVTRELRDIRALSEVSGSDLSSLKINLNIDSQLKVDGQDFFGEYFRGDVGYFRINVTATENYDAWKKRVGRSVIVVKITRATAQIQTKLVSVNDGNSKVSLTPEVVCEKDVNERTLCPVVRGQIVGVSFNAQRLGLEESTGADISWTLNNQPLRCDSHISSDAGCGNGQSNFFPVTGELGELYSLSMTANNPLTGKSITLTKAYKIVSPSVLVVSEDSAKVWPRYLGQYVDVNNAVIDNYSQDIFEASSETPFQLKGLFYPSSLRGGAQVTWTVDGVTVEPDSKGLVTIDASKPSGSLYTVVLRGFYSPSQKEKRALSDIWGISLASLTESNLSQNIQVQMTESVDGVTLNSFEKSKKFFASIISYVPESVIYLFRLLVTMVVIFVTIGLIFSFVPENRRI